MGVGSSDPKQQTSFRDVDMVYPVWRHTEVHKRTGKGVTSLIEYTRTCKRYLQALHMPKSLKPVLRVMMNGYFVELTLR